MTEYAFPTMPIQYSRGDQTYPVTDGMTLRDYFAAKAMQGLVAARAWHPEFIYPADFNFDAGKRAAEAVAEAAYNYADAMLEARK